MASHGDEATSLVSAVEEERGARTSEEDVAPSQTRWWRRSVHAALVGAVVCGAVLVLSTSRGAGGASPDTALSTDWSEIVEELSEATGGVYVTNEFAQCYTGFCAFPSLCCCSFFLLFRASFDPRVAHVGVRL